MRVRYRPTAARQISSIHAYLAARNAAAAHRVIGVIRGAIYRLAILPYSGRPTESPGIRQLAIVRYPYLVFYTVDEVRQEVLILRVRHTAQDPSQHLGE